MNPGWGFSLGPVAVLMLALLLGCVISTVATLALKRYIDHAERESEGKLLPGRFRR